jgi:2-polyprenyl-6-methoxyphenol hydroxylase-like FAD-dependent oxidoreductase
MEEAAEDPGVELAVIGAGLAGTSVAASLQQARPDWSIVLLAPTRGQARPLGWFESS